MALQLKATTNVMSMLRNVSNLDEFTLHDLLSFFHYLILVLVLLCILKYFWSRIFAAVFGVVVSIAFGPPFGVSAHRQRSATICTVSVQSLIVSRSIAKFDFADVVFGYTASPYLLAPVCAAWAHDGAAMTQMALPEGPPTARWEILAFLQCLLPSFPRNLAAQTFCTDRSAADCCPSPSVGNKPLGTASILLDNTLLQISVSDIPRWISNSFSGSRQRSCFLKELRGHEILVRPGYPSRSCFMVPKVAVKFFCICFIARRTGHWSVQVLSHLTPDSARIHVLYDDRCAGSVKDSGGHD